MPDTLMEWDVFISHATEDKSSCVEPIAASLEQHGFAVWYDKFTLKLGDSLRQSIDRGLARSRYGVVVLSKAFFQKRWPQVELDGLLEREIHGSKVILPVWHGVSAEDVRARSPMLAGKLAVSTDDGIDAVVSAIIDVLEQPIRPKRTTPPPAAQTPDDLETLAKNLWWIAQSEPNRTDAAEALQSVLDQLRRLQPPPTKQPIPAVPQESLIVPAGANRFDQFVAIGRSGRPEDVDFLMDVLVRETHLGSTKLVDYVLGLVGPGTGQERIHWYLFNGTQIQRNYAALCFKRRGDKKTLQNAVSAGKIDRLQAFSS